jgi:hypothetical protein
MIFDDWRLRSANLEFVMQLCAVDSGAVGCPTDRRAAHSPEPFSMRTADCRTSWCRRELRCR